MYRHTLRNTIVSGTFTLPVMLGLTAVGWLSWQLYDAAAWGSFCMAVVTAYCLMELNNGFALMRMRTRMVSTSFLFLLLLFPAYRQFDLTLSCSLSLVVSYFMLFNSYQAYRPEGYIFYAFLCVGLGSLAFPPLLAVAPTFYVSMLLFLRSLTLRSGVAGLLGLALPYWVVLAVKLWSDGAVTMPDPAAWPGLCNPADYAAVSTTQWVGGGMVAFYSLLALVHLSRNALTEKIRTRMLLATVAAVEVVLLLLWAVMPARFDVCLHLLIANGSILMAHYFSHGRGRLFDLWFNLTLLLLIGLGLLNHLYPG